MRKKLFFIISFIIILFAVIIIRKVFLISSIINGQIQIYNDNKEYYIRCNSIFDDNIKTVSEVLKTNNYEYMKLNDQELIYDINNKILYQKDKETNRYSKKESDTSIIGSDGLITSLYDYSTSNLIDKIRFAFEWKIIDDKGQPNSYYYLIIDNKEYKIDKKIIE